MRAIKGDWTDRRRELLREAWKLGSDEESLKNRLRYGTTREQTRKAKVRGRMIESDSVEMSER